MILKLRTFWHKVYRSYEYLRHVWTTGDFDWDYGFLERIVLLRLKHMRDYQASHDLSADHNRVTKQLRYAVWLMEERNRLEVEWETVKEGMRNFRRAEELEKRWWRHVQHYYKGWWE